MGDVVGIPVVVKVPLLGAWWTAEPGASDASSAAITATVAEPGMGETFELLAAEGQLGRWTLRPWGTGARLGLDEATSSLVSGTGMAELTCSVLAPNTQTGFPFNQALILQAPGGDVGVDATETGRLRLVEPGFGTAVEVHPAQTAWTLHNPAEDPSQRAGFLQLDNWRLVLNPNDPTTGPGRTDTADWVFVALKDGFYAVTHKVSGQRWQADAFGGQPVQLGAGGRWQIRTDDGESLTFTYDGAPTAVLGWGASRGAPALPEGSIWLCNPARVGRAVLSWVPTARDIVQPSVFTELGSADPGHDCPTGYTARRFAAWMGFVKDDTRIRDMVIPGTHDSGTYNMGRFDDEMGAVTQDYNLLGQLLAGARYLDLRLCHDDNGTVVIQHGVLNGEAFEPMLHDIALFLSVVPTEFLILDLSVTPDCVDEVRELFRYILEADTLAATEFFHDVNGVSVPDPDLTLGTLRRHGRRYLTTWNRTGTSPLAWQITNELIWDSSANFDDTVWKGPVDGIVNHIRQYMADWRDPTKNFRNRLSKIQAISTPAVSPSGSPALGAGASAAIGAAAGMVILGPVGAALGAGVGAALGAAGITISTAIGAGGGPRTIEDRDGPALTQWVLSLGPDDPVNIVMRDFIDRNAPSIAWLIGLNYRRGNVIATAGFAMLIDIADNPNLDSTGPSAVTPTSGQLLERVRSPVPLPSGNTP